MKETLADTFAAALSRGPAESSGFAASARFWKLRVTVGPFTKTLSGDHSLLAASPCTHLDTFTLNFPGNFQPALPQHLCCEKLASMSSLSHHPQHKCDPKRTSEDYFSSLQLTTLKVAIPQTLCEAACISGRQSDRRCSSSLGSERCLSTNNVAGRQWQETRRPHSQLDRVTDVKASRVTYLGVRVIESVPVLTRILNSNFQGGSKNDSGQDCVSGLL